MSPAEVAELGDALDSKSSGALPRAGSIPAFGIGLVAAGLHQLANRRRATREVRTAVMTLHVAVLTGGGDCPGLNAVIRAVARRSCDRGERSPRRPRRLARADRGAARAARAARGLGHPAARRDDHRHARARTRTRSTEASSACSRTSAGWGSTRSWPIGGEDTLGVAASLHAEHGVAVVGVPKTIDNDLSATDYTFGFDTARLDRDRGDRPAAHDGRVAQPRHGRRGDGPPHRLDRGRERDRGRRGRDPDTGVPADGRGGVRARSGTATPGGRTSRSSS